MRNTKLELATEARNRAETALLIEAGLDDDDPIREAKIIAAANVWRAAQMHEESVLRISSPMFDPKPGDESKHRERIGEALLEAAVDRKSPLELHRLANLYAHACDIEDEADEEKKTA